MSFKEASKNMSLSAVISTIEKKYKDGDVDNDIEKHIDYILELTEHQILIETDFWYYRFLAVYVNGCIFRFLNNDTRDFGVFLMKMFNERIFKNLKKINDDVVHGLPLGLADNSYYIPVVDDFLSEKYVDKESLEIYETFMLNCLGIGFPFNIDEIDIFKRVFPETFRSYIKL